MTGNPASTRLSSPLVHLEGVAREHAAGDSIVHALHPTDLDIDAGEFVVLLGPSGSGKTTLLNLVGSMDVPTAGRLLVGGVDLTALDRQGRLAYRQRQVGMVFQFHNLIPTLTARENVELAADLAGARDRIDACLRAVGLHDRRHHFPHEMSGGEQQRVAVARALVKAPALLLGDEPTGNLDAPTGRAVLRLFREANAQGACVLLVTHNAVLARLATRVITLSNGRVHSDEQNPAPADPDDLDW